MQDPLADGPTIQAAATRALANGTTLDKVLAVVERVSPRIRAQLVMFTYYNPIMRRGAERFCQQAKAAGASGATNSLAFCGTMSRYVTLPVRRGAALPSLHEVQAIALCASEHAQRLHARCPGGPQMLCCCCTSETRSFCATLTRAHASL